MAAALKVLVGILAATSATLLYFLIYEFNPFLRRCNPDVCQSYALSAFKAHRVMHQGAGHCEYGMLPGFLTFNVMKPPGSRWQTAVSSCQLQNRLLPAAATGDVKVLLLGDSVDAHLAKEWCTALEQPLRFTPSNIKGQVAGLAAGIAAKATSSSSSKLAESEDCCKDRDVFYYCKPEEGLRAAGSANAATGGSISVGMFHLLGVHLDGPYHTGAKGNFLTRIPLALKTYNATFGGPPDMVIVHSNFWDQSRMWEQQQPGYGALNKLLPEVVFSWSSNFSLLLSTTAEYLPEETLIATRTAAFPAFTANWLGRWQYIHQLNMAAVEVTRLHGHAVVDLGAMVFGLEPRQYLVDQHHPNKILLLECANIAMNLLYQKRKGAEAAAEQIEAVASSSSSSSSTGSDADSQPKSGSSSSSSTASSGSSEAHEGSAGSGTNESISNSDNTVADAGSSSGSDVESSSSSNVGGENKAQLAEAGATQTSADMQSGQQSGGVDAENREQQQKKKEQKQAAVGELQSPAVTAQTSAREQQQVDDSKGMG